MLLPVAALGVHEARYRLGFGADAAEVGAAHGHGYLDSVAPLAMLVLALALGGFLVRLGTAARGHVTARPRRAFLAVWVFASAGLVAIYSAQELLEGVLAPGHPAGLAGVFGSGGWWSIVAAVVFGAALATLVRDAAAVVASVERSSGRPRLRVRRAEPLQPRAVLLSPRPALASAAAGRAPPG
jgi:hypothetical protein